MCDTHCDTNRNTDIAGKNIAYKFQNFNINLINIG